MTTNADLPENGLEGLAQVITCEDIIGWRPRDSGIGTRVILFMTDQEFHFAGEGRVCYKTIHMLYMRRIKSLPAAGWYSDTLRWRVFIGG